MENLARVQEIKRFEEIERIRNQKGEGTKRENNKRCKDFNTNET